METHSSSVARFSIFASFLVLLILGLSMGQRAWAADSLGNHFPIEYQNQDFVEPAADASFGSGVTFRPAQEAGQEHITLVLDNGSPRQLRQYKPGSGNTYTYMRKITLSGFTDPEDIHWIDKDTYVISQEEHAAVGSTDELVVISIPYGTTDATVILGGAGTHTRRLEIHNDKFVSADNKGIEAVVVLGDSFYFTTETAASTGWKLWRMATNTGAGVVPTSQIFDVFDLNVSTRLQGRADDVSGLATDGTNLWFISDVGNGSPRGRVLRFTLSGDLIADYYLPGFTSPVAGWQQAEGIELFHDPVDNIKKLLLTGEVGGGSGVDFMRLTIREVNIVATTPNGWEASPYMSAQHPVFTISRNGVTTPSINVSYAVSSSSTASGSDYTLSASSPLTFTSGQPSRTVTANVTDDAVYEDNETVILNLVPGINYILGAQRAATGTVNSVATLLPLASHVGAAVRGLHGRAMVGSSWPSWYSLPAQWSLSAGSWQNLSPALVDFPETIASPVWATGAGYGIYIEPAVVGNGVAGYDEWGNPIYHGFWMRRGHPDVSHSGFTNDLTIFGGGTSFSMAHAINQSSPDACLYFDPAGQVVVGVAQNWSSQLEASCWWYEPGLCEIGGTVLGMLSGDTGSEAFGVNDMEETMSTIVGESRGSSGTRPVVWPSAGGGITALPFPGVHNRGTARDVNNNEVIVGWTWPSSTGLARATRWHLSGGVYQATLLAPPPGSTTATYALRNNDDDITVGYAYNSDDGYRAVLWDSAGFHFLDEYLATGSTLKYIIAYDINNGGDIGGQLLDGTATKAFFLAR